MKKYLSACFLGLSIGCFGAGDALPNNLALSNLLGSFQSFHAHFHEVAGARTADGELWIQKPGKFYWKTLTLNGESFLSDGQNLYHYEPDLLQATKTPLSGALEQTPLLILSGKITELSHSYEVKSLGKEAFRLVPKASQDSGELIQSMEVQFQSGKLSSFSLKSRLGQSTTVTFSQVEWNPVLPSSIFQFVLPPGADLFEG